LRFCLAIAYFAVLLGVAWLTRAYHSGPLSGTVIRQLTPGPGVTFSQWFTGLVRLVPDLGSGKKTRIWFYPNEQAERFWHTVGDLEK
jgi:hypothetical protein